MGLLVDSLLIQDFSVPQVQLPLLLFFSASLAFICTYYFVCSNISAKKLNESHVLGLIGWNAKIASTI